MERSFGRFGQHLVVLARVAALAAILSPGQRQRLSIIT
jgi:hypothetical protein